jgi:hypothetical protein
MAKTKKPSLEELELEAKREALQEELRASNVRLSRQLTQAKAKTGELVQAVYQGAKDAALMTKLPKPVPVPKRSKQKGREEVALLHLTDWQYGKVGATYSPEICESRIGTQLVNKVIQIANIQRADHPINSIHVMLGGDMVEGLNIFPGQAYEVGPHLFEQLFAVSSLMEKVIRALLAEFDHVEVWEEYGNHGRLGRKGEYPAGDNIDRMAYKVTSQKFVNEKRVTWHPSTNWYSLVHIGNYKALLIHGDEIKSFGGNIPAFGIMRKVNAWATGVIEPFVDAYMGHFHTPMMLTIANGGRAFITGSPESENEYAREFCAATGIPSQRLNFIDADLGRVTSEYVLWLD